MQLKKLGNSEMAITPIGVGAWAIGGGGYAFGWGDQDDAKSIGAIRAALDAGMNWIDTAAVYGLGHSEEVVAKALEGVSNRPYVFTKCERCWDENGQIFKSLKPDSLRKECEDSLRRLNVDVIDLYQVHWPEPDEDIEEGWTALAELQREGKLRYIGASNFSASQMARAQKIAPITSLQPPYSLLRRGIEDEILPHALATGVGVIVYSPMASGLLSGTMSAQRVAELPKDDWRTRSAEFQEPKLTHNLAVAAKLGEIAHRHGRTAGEAAIAWTLRHPAVTAAIVGVRGPEQVPGVAGALGFRLSDAEAKEAEAVL